MQNSFVVTPRFFARFQGAQNRHCRGALRGEGALLFCDSAGHDTLSPAIRDAISCKVDDKRRPALYNGDKSGARSVNGNARLKRLPFRIPRRSFPREKGAAFHGAEKIAARFDGMQVGRHG